MDIDEVKQHGTFFDLIQLDETGLFSIGVHDETVRKKLALAIRNWLDKYRFPGR